MAITDEDRRNFKIRSRIKHDYDYVESKGYKVFGVFLQGSQNYELDYAGSDIDTKCIVLPSFEDIVLKKPPVSTTLILEDNSHIDLKDVRLMWDCFRKQNINFLEILFTNYWEIRNIDYLLQWQDMMYMAENIAHYNNYAAVNCIAGMVFEKRKALCHPYPSIKDKVEKYGYDNKQLHHIIRCEEFLRRYIDDVPYEDCLIPTNKEHLINVKSKYIYNVDEAKQLAKELEDKVKEIKQNYMDTHECKVNHKVSEYMDKILVNILKISLMQDMEVHNG